MSYEAAKLKLKQLDAEIRSCDARPEQKSSMLHSLSKLWMFASDSLLNGDSVENTDLDDPA